MIDVNGDEIERLRKRIGELQDNVQDKAVRAGLVYASIPLKDKMKSLAPRATGALVRSIGHESLSVTARARIGVGADTVAITVGPKKVRVTARQAQRGITRSRFSGEAWLVNILDETGAKPHEIFAAARNPKNTGRNRRLLKKYGKDFAEKKIAERKKAIKLPNGFAARIKHPGFRPRNFISGALESTGNLIPERFWEGVERYMNRKAA